MKKILLIDSQNLAAIKQDISNPYLVDKLVDAEVELESPAMEAIIDMIQSEEGEELSFIFDDDYEGTGY